MVKMGLVHNLHSRTKALATSTARVTAFRSGKQQPPDPAPPACSICQEPMGQRTPEGIVESWAALPCGHRFGSACIKTWLGTADQPTCPICRLPMEHACGHPVLPMLVPPIPGGGVYAPPSRVSSFASSSATASGGGAPAPAPSRGRGGWRGRGLDESCGFCAVQRKRLPWRLAVLLVRLLLRRRRRQRMIQSPQTIVYADQIDPWAAAFDAWWAEQEPKSVPSAARTSPSHDSVSTRSEFSADASRQLPRRLPALFSPHGSDYDDADDFRFSHVF